MLIISRRFLPFFITQFLGAFNDNLFKNALLVYLTFSLTADSRTLSLYTNLAMALFIAPMLLFSAWSGLLAERFEKHDLIFKIKLFEVFIMLLGIVAFLTGQIWLMMCVLCLLGLQSTFFGPVKYGILPERLCEDELMLGNGIVEAGTFLAILVGTLLGSYLVSLHTMQWLLLLVMLLSAVGGLVSAEFIPKDSFSVPKATLPPCRPLKQTVFLLRETAKNKVVIESILAISWFWLLGGALLTQIPQYSKDILMGNPSVTTYLLILFSAGVGLGSLSAYWLSHGRIEPGLVPFGGLLLGISLAGIISITPQTQQHDLVNFATFYEQGLFWRTTLSFFGLAFAGGIYVVPLYALIQTRSPAGYKSQTIAANNIVNSLFMVAVSLLALFLLSVLGWSFQMFFTLLLILHIVINIYIFAVVPEFIMRLIMMLVMGLCYRLRISGRRNLPKTGAAFLICNHITYLDPVILSAVVPRPIRFIMYHKIYYLPVLHWFFKMARAIPIAPRHECLKTYEQALESVHEALQNGELVGIFPEGKLTVDGTLQPFREGIERMLERDPVPVVPAALGNLWGSFFSHQGGICRGLPRKWMAIVSLSFGVPLPSDSSAVEMQVVVSRLLRHQLR